MNTMIDLMKTEDIRRIGTEALAKALGPVGMAKYLETYDNGGTGDYTEEKYKQPELSIEDILKM